MAVIHSLKKSISDSNAVARFLWFTFAHTKHYAINLKVLGMAKQNNLSDVAYSQYEKSFTGNEEFERKKNSIFINNNYSTKCFCKQRLNLTFARFLPVFQVF